MKDFIERKNLLRREFNDLSATKGESENARHGPLVKPFFRKSGYLEICVESEDVRLFVFKILYGNLPSVGERYERTAY